MPSLRYGKNSLLKFLSEEGLLDLTLQNEVIELYGSLSGAIHSEISKLNIINGNLKAYDEWYSNLLKTGQLSLNLILRMVENGM